MWRLHSSSFLKNQWFLLGSDFHYKIPSANHIIGQTFLYFPPFVPPTSKETSSCASKSQGPTATTRKNGCREVKQLWFCPVTYNTIQCCISVLCGGKKKKSMRSTSRSQLRIIHFTKINHAVYDCINRQGNKSQVFKGRDVRWDFLTHLTTETLIAKMSLWNWESSVRRHEVGNKLAILAAWMCEKHRNSVQ